MNRVTAVGVQQVQTPPATTAAASTTGGAAAALSPWLQQYVIPRVNPAPAATASAAAATNTNTVQGARTNRNASHNVTAGPSRAAPAMQSRAAVSSASNQNRNRPQASANPRNPQATVNPFAQRTNPNQSANQHTMNMPYAWGVSQQAPAVTASWNTGVRISMNTQGQTHGHSQVQAQASTHSNRGSNARDPRIAAAAQRNQAQAGSSQVRSAASGRPTWRR